MGVIKEDTRSLDFCSNDPQQSRQKVLDAEASGLGKIIPYNPRSIIGV